MIQMVSDQKFKKNVQLFLEKSNITLDFSSIEKKKGDLLCMEKTGALKLLDKEGNVLREKEEVIIQNKMVKDFFSSNADVLCIYGIGIPTFYEAIKKDLEQDSKKRLIILEDDIAYLSAFLQMNVAESLLTDDRVDIF